MSPRSTAEVHNATQRRALHAGCEYVAEEHLSDGPAHVTDALHPPGRRRLRSAVRPDGYETWTIGAEQYATLREFILDRVAELDAGDGVLLKDLIEVASLGLSGNALFPSGRFTNWIRFVKVDLECEGALERIPRSSPQRVRLPAE